MLKPYMPLNPKAQNPKTPKPQTLKTLKTLNPCKALEALSFPKTEERSRFGSNVPRGSKYPLIKEYYLNPIEDPTVL